MFKEIKLWWWSRKLNSKSADERKAAAEALGNLGDKRTVNPLIKALGDKDDCVHGDAARALGKLGDISAVDLLIKALEDKGENVRRAAAHALGQLGDKRAVEPLIKALGDDNSNVRFAAANALSKLGQPQWSEWVKGDDCDFERLGLSGDTRAIEPLIKALGAHDRRPLWFDCSLIDAAAIALGQSGDARAVEPLIEVVRDCASGDRCAAANVLGQLGDTRAVEPLIKAIGDRDPIVRSAAATALGKLGDARAVGPLITVIGDGCYYVRVAAANALNKLGHPQWSEWVKGDNRDFERLALSGNSQVLESLIKALWDLEYSVGIAAATALGKMGSCAVAPLIKALNNRPNYCREVVIAAIVNALGQLGDARAVEPLIYLLGDDNSDISNAAAAALTKLGAYSGAPLINALTYHYPDIRRAAANVLSKLGQPQWSEWVKGDDCDFERLGLSGDTRAMELLIRALSDWRSHLRTAHRIAVAAALGQSGDARAVEPLINALGGYGYDSDECCAVVTALGQLGDARAVEPLITLIGDGRRVRAAAANALSKLGHPQWCEWVKGDDYQDFERLGKSGDTRAFEPLIKALGNKNNDLYREAIIDALGELGDARAFEPLCQVLRNRSVSSEEHFGLMPWERKEWEKRLLHEIHNRAAAAEALGQLGDARAVEPLISVLGKEYESLRCAAAEALEKLGEPKWEEIVKGDDGDFDRLKACGDARINR